MPEKKIRVLIAKPGLDGHDRGAKIIARALRDAGMEVIYTGLRQTPEMIASAAVQEDVDVIGLSILSGAHNTICPQLMKLLHDKGMSDVTVLVGGIIPEADIPALKQSVIAEIFLPGTSTQDIDRKSTRLNSSHGYISYAVFCLIKQKCFQADRATARCTGRRAGPARPHRGLTTNGVRSTASTRAPSNTASYKRQPWLTWSPQAT